MPISTLKGYPRIGGVIGYGPVGGSGVWKLQERYALADDFYDDVSLLLKMNGANGSTTFLDSSNFGHSVTANGDAQISTAQSKFGGSSAYFDGTGDYLSVAANSAFAFGTGDFTAEFWLHTLASSSMSIVDQWVQSAGSYATGQWQVYKNADDTISIYIATSASTFTQLQSATTLSTGVFYHLAVVRSGGTIKLYINGAEDANTLAYANAIGVSGSPVKIGVQSNNNSAPFNGYIDSLRITKGQARYTAAFTPPQRDFLP